MRLARIVKAGDRMQLPRTILVATDFSELADEGLAYAVDLASRLDATIHLLHVITVPIMGMAEIGMAYGAVTMEATTKEAQAVLDGLVARYRERAAIAAPRLEVGDPRDVIDRIAEEINADLIVMGTHGRRGVRRVLLGSVAESVVRSAPCPVLTLRPKLRS
ncbi:MAG: universal stress protein [Kofleriaceae bacterium]